MDSFGHVNNGVYANYLETARGDYLEQIGLSFNDFHKLRRYPVIAKVVIEYKTPAFFGDILSISAHVTKMGRSSITLAYKIENQQNILNATAETVMVFVDEKGKPAVLPDIFRKPFEE